MAWLGNSVAWSTARGVAWGVPLGHGRFRTWHMAWRGVWCGVGSGVGRCRSMELEWSVVWGQLYSRHDWGMVGSCIEWGVA